MISDANARQLSPMSVIGLALDAAGGMNSVAGDHQTADDEGPARGSSVVEGSVVRFESGLGRQGMQWGGRKGSDGGGAGRDSPRLHSLPDNTLNPCVVSVCSAPLTVLQSWIARRVCRFVSLRSILTPIQGLAAEHPQASSSIAALAHTRCQRRNVRRGRRRGRTTQEDQVGRRKYGLLPTWTDEHPPPATHRH